MANLRANPKTLAVFLLSLSFQNGGMAFSPLSSGRASTLTRSAPSVPSLSSSSSSSLGRSTNQGFWAASNPNEWMNEQELHLEEKGISADFDEALQQHQRQPINPTPALVAALQNNLAGSNSGSKSVGSWMLGMMIVMATTFAASDPAMAAMSGGRAGGGGYSRAPMSRPSMSRPAPSRSYYGGGGGYGGYASRPNVYINPGPTFVTPFSPLMPFSPYGYGGGAVAISRGPSFFDLLFFGGLAFTVLNAVRGFTDSATDSLPWTSSENMASPLGPGTTVAQISVAIQVPNRDDPNSILNVLPRMANNANTERRTGLQNLTSQVALELLRRKSNIVSASTSYQHFRDRTKAEQAFGQVSIRERSKFEKEGFSKFRGSDWGQSQRSSAPYGDQATMAVVTLLVDIDGDSTKLPGISSLRSVEEALQKIASDTRVGECLQSAEILWTPEERSETLTQREVVADYPELRSV